MQVKILDASIQKKEFNEVVHHPLQSWEWGEARIKMGTPIIRIGEFENTILINAFQMSIHVLPFTSYKIGYLPRSVFPSPRVLDFLYDYARRHNIIFIKIEPYTQFDDWKKETLLSYMVVSSHPQFPQYTQILDLTPADNILLSKMKAKTRYNIKLAQKKGVIVKELSDEEGFNLFSTLYFETCRRQKYFGHNLMYHKTIWNTLKTNIAHILVAFYNQIPLAAYELFHFKNTLYYPYGGTSHLYRNTMAANLLMWEAIKLGKTLGCTRFDMWGSLPESYEINHPWAGFTRFKEGYGGKCIKFAPGLDLVANKVLYAVYGHIYTLRNLYLNLKKNV